MRRATITIPDDLDDAIDRFIQAQPVPPTLTAIVQTALRAYFGRPELIPSARSANESTWNEADSFNHAALTPGEIALVVDRLLEERGDDVATTPSPAELRSLLVALGVRVPRTALSLRTATSPGGEPLASSEHDRHVADMHQ